MPGVASLHPVSSEGRYGSRSSSHPTISKFLREGIEGHALTPEQAAEREDKGIAPSVLDFDSQEIDRAIYNKDSNCKILQNLLLINRYKEVVYEEEIFYPQKKILGGMKALEWML